MAVRLQGPAAFLAFYADRPGTGIYRSDITVRVFPAAGL
jgi:hypothetical protein